MATATRNGKHRLPKKPAAEADSTAQSTPRSQVQLLNEMADLALKFNGLVDDFLDGRRGVLGTSIITLDALASQRAGMTRGKSERDLDTYHDHETDEIVAVELEDGERTGVEHRLGRLAAGLKAVSFDGCELVVPAEHAAAFMALADLETQVFNLLYNLTACSLGDDQ